MKHRGGMFLKVLINRYHQGAATPLMRFLPKEEADIVSNLNIASAQLEPLVNQGKEILQKIHYSWLKPFVETFPASTHPFFIASLPKKLGIALVRHWNGAIEASRLAHSLRPFFLRILYRSLHAEEHLPIEFLPETPLTPLVRWSKHNLVELIDFLGLHDLTAEIRRVVSKQALAGIYECLQPKHLAYLKICLHKKDHIVAPPLNLNYSQLDCRRLQRELHQRGLMRLGKALAGQHSDLIWYITRTLDIGRGQLLSRFCSAETPPKITQALIVQVTNLMNFLKKGSL